MCKLFTYVNQLRGDYLVNGKELGEKIKDIMKNIEERVKQAEERLKEIDIRLSIPSVSYRSNVVASRIGNEELSVIDMLIEAGLFKTRSEAVAYLVGEGIKARKDIIKKVSSSLKEITSFFFSRIWLYSRL